MARASVRFDIDANALYDAIQHAENLPEVIDGKASQIADKANAMSSGYRTEEITDPKTKRKRGGTKPSYRTKPARIFGRSMVGLVYTANYSAQKENHEHNTLAKAMG